MSVEKKIILFLSNNSKSLLLCAGYIPQKEGFLWAEQRFVTGRERKAKRASSCFSGERAQRVKVSYNCFLPNGEIQKNEVYTYSLF